MTTGISPINGKNFAYEGVAIVVAGTAVQLTFNDNVRQLTINSPTIDIYIGYTEAEVGTAPTGAAGSRVFIPADTWTVKGWQGKTVWIVNAVALQTAADIYVLGEQ